MLFTDSTIENKLVLDARLIYCVPLINAVFGKACIFLFVCFGSLKFFWHMLLPSLIMSAHGVHVGEILIGVKTSNMLLI